MNICAQLTTLMATVMVASLSQAKLVTLEDGESFAGHYQVETQERDCGYNPTIQNSLLGRVNVFAGFKGVRMESVVDQYALGGGLIVFHNLELVNRLPYEMTEYLSSTEMESYFSFRFNEKDPLTVIEKNLKVDQSGNLKLMIKDSRKKDLVCHYTLISKSLR